MLDALIAVVAALLVLGGVLIMFGPQTASIVRRIRSLQRPEGPLRGPLALRRGEAVPPGLNPKTQRVLVSATRLATSPLGEGRIVVGSPPSAETRPAIWSR